MGEKVWVTLGIPGMGDVSAWLDSELLSIGDSRIDAENLTQILVGPKNQLGLRRLANRCTLNLNTIAYWTFTPDEIVRALSNMWDTKTIIEPNDDEKRRFVKHD